MRRPNDSNRGRPAHFSREYLLQVDSALRMLPARETSIGVHSFVSQYLSILDFPPDVREPLGRGDINLFEAHQMARLTPKRLNCAEGEASRHRRKLLKAHLLREEPGPGLCERVMVALGELREPDPMQTEIAAVEKVDDLLEADLLEPESPFLRRVTQDRTSLARGEAGGANG